MSEYELSIKSASKRTSTTSTFIDKVPIWLWPLFLVFYTYTSLSYLITLPLVQSIIEAEFVWSQRLESSKIKRRKFRKRTFTIHTCLWLAWNTFIHEKIPLFYFCVWPDNFIFDHLVLNKSSGSWMHSKYLLDIVVSVHTTTGSHLWLMVLV